MKYFFEIVKGTEDIFQEEIYSKFPESKNTQFSIQSRGKIVALDLSNEYINDFRILKTPLRVSNETGRKINLFRKDWKINNVPAGINPNLAYILCKISNIETSDVIYDPFCGAGTIAITAKLDFNAKKIIGSDVSGKAIDYSIGNAKAANLKKNDFAFFRSNVYQIKLQPKSVDKIITNPPFGIREQNHDENVKIYKTLERVAYSALKDEGIICIITTEKNLIDKNFSKNKWNKLKEVSIEQGGLYPSIYLFKKNTI